MGILYGGIILVIALSTSITIKESKKTRYDMFESCLEKFDSMAVCKEMIDGDKEKENSK